MTDFSRPRLVYFDDASGSAHVELTDAEGDRPGRTRVIIVFPFDRVGSDTNHDTDHRAKAEAKKLLQSALEQL